jgi:DNA-binding NarL/FixJ family response regulator
MLESMDGVEEVLEASNGAKALELLSASEFDLVLLDIRMPVMDGITVLKRMKSNATVLVLTNYGDSASVREAITWGAKGFLVYGDISPDKLEETIHRSLGGGMFLSDSAARALRQGMGVSPDGKGGFDLTGREREVMEVLAEGSTRAVIAERFGITQQTVNVHLSNIYSKLGVSSSQQAVARWRELYPSAKS